MLTIKSQPGKNIILFLAAVTLFAGCRPPGVRALLQGKKLLEIGRPQLAVEKLRVAVVLLGNTNAQAFNYLGLACHYTGRSAEAERAYQRALALSPDLVEARYNLGCLWLSQNKLEQAKAELTAYTLRRSNSLEGWLRLGTAQWRSRDLAAAERSFGEALRLGPQNPEALTGFGLVHFQRNHSAAEAAGYFAKALRAQRDYGPALLNLAIVAQANLKDRQLALRTYRDYLSLKPPPDNMDAVKVIVHQLEQELAAPPRLARGSDSAAQPVSNPPRPVVAEGTPNTNQPRAVITEPPRLVTTLKPEPPNNQARLLPATSVVKSPPAVASMPQTNFEVVKIPAEPVFNAAEDVPPPPAAPSTGTLAASATVPAVTTATKPPKRSFLQKINPINLFSGESKPSSHPTSHPTPTGSVAVEHPEILVTDSDAAGTAAMRASARYAYHLPARLEAGNRSEAERSFAQGAKAQEAQNLAEAIQAYRRATQLDASYFDAHYNLGLAAFQQGNLPIALMAYENALTILPESEDARYNFALALKQANYPIDAANELEKVLTIYPNDSRAQLALGNLYAQQLREPAKARQHYLKMLESDPRNSQAPAVRYWLTANPK